MISLKMDVGHRRQRLDEDHVPLFNEHTTTDMKVDNEVDNKDLPLPSIQVDNGANTTTASGDSSNSTNASETAPKPVNKILFLDGLRGLAAIHVVLVHSHFMRPFTNPGAWAVDTFFVLSAFLLTMIFDKKAHQLVQTSASRWKWFISIIDYFQRRFLRVYPLYAFVAIVLACMSQDQRERYYIVRSEYDLFKTLTFTRGHTWFLFWTLPLEIKYYFFIPLFVVIMMAFGNKWWIPVFPVYFWVFYTTAFDHLDNMPLEGKFQIFVAGSMSAIVYVRIQEIIKRNNFEFNQWHRLALRVIEYITLAYLVSTCIQGLLFDWLFSNPFPEVEDSNRFITLHICILIVIEMLSPSEFSQCLEWNVFRAWGKISFSAYLLHPFVIFRPWVENQPTFNRLFGQMAFVYVLCTISFHVIEFPLQKAAGKISRFLASKTIRDLPYEVVPKFAEHFSVFRSRR